MVDFKEMKTTFWRYKSVLKCSSDTHSGQKQTDKVFFYMYINFRSYFEANGPNCIDISAKYFMANISICDRERQNGH